MVATGECCEGGVLESGGRHAGEWREACWRVEGGVLKSGGRRAEEWREACWRVERGRIYGRRVEHEPKTCLVSCI